MEFLRKISKDEIVFGQININSIRNKFDSLMAAVAGNIDILSITETKIDSGFPVNQFYLNGYNVPFRHKTLTLTFTFAMTSEHV